MLLNTKDKLTIVEENQDTVVCSFDIGDSVFDLTMSSFKEFIGGLVADIQPRDNVIIQLHFGQDSNREEVIEMIDIFTEAIVERLIDKKKAEEVWQPTNEIVERLALLLKSQIELANHTTKINNFNIQMYYENEKIYEMIG